MIKGITGCGFEFAVEKANMENMEMLELLAANEAGNPMIYPKLTEMILGVEQKRMLYDHLRDEKGRVSVQKVIAAVDDVFRAFGESGKN